MFADRFENLDAAPGVGIDCICLTLNAEAHLEETLDAWYKEAPVRRLLVIDGGSKDKTLDILVSYPRVTIWNQSNMTTGKSWGKLKDMVQTPWFIWIDVGKIPASGWYDEMMKHTEEGDILGSKRYNYHEGIPCGYLEEDPIIKNPSLRILGGPLLVKTSIPYHVDDDYTQRCFDIVMKRQLEECGGRYHLVTSASHRCYLPVPITDKEELRKRHEMNAKGIIKYITPEYARTNASYLLDDHWMLMLSKLSKDFILSTNPSWLPVVKSWRRRRYIQARASRIIYRAYKSILGESRSKA